MKDMKWMLKASVLGLAFFIAVLLIKPIGVSTQFSVLSGMIHSTIDKGVITEDESRDSGYISTNAYYDKDEGKLAKNIKNPINYDFVFVLAIPLGAILAKLVLSKKKSKDSTFVVEGIENLKVEKGNFIKTYAPSFLSGFLLLFGARMADGCTSGHMMSGMMQGSVSGFFFAIAVFAIAIPTAIFTEKRSMNKGVL